MSDGTSEPGTDEDPAPDQVDAGLGAVIGSGPGTSEQVDDALPDVHGLPGGAPAALEAVLMVADEPVSAVRLAVEVGLPTEEVEALLTGLAAEYRGEDGERPRGFELREVAGGWRIYSAPVFHEVVGRFVLDGQTSRLTQAALETLAVIAYRQPVTRGQVSGVRGVNVDGVVRTLTTRGLITEAGTDPESGAVLYRTTGYFLERMCLSTLDQLPPLAPYLPEMSALEGLDGMDRASGTTGENA